MQQCEDVKTKLMKYDECKTGREREREREKKKKKLHN